MRTTNKIIIAAILIVVLLISIGYAAIQNITLNISGTASASADDANFKVKFLETTEVSDSSKVTATVTNDTNAAINVIGLTAKGQSVTATYTVQNVSADLSANLSVNTTNNNEEYFVIESNLGKTSLVAGEVTSLVVTVELIKTPITTDEVASIGIGLTAEPVQPGEEGGLGSGIGGGNTGSGETTTLASVTNANIGDYIDLGNNIVGTESTTDDWRVLYVENGTVYAILADYLPNSTGYAKNAGLDTSNTYGVYSEEDRDTLINGLTTTTYWNGLANGISGATVTGTPTAELLMKGYNTKNGTDVDYTTEPELEASDLYMPHTRGIDSCFGFWLATIDEEWSYYMWRVECDGCVGGGDYDGDSYGVRPVVALPSSTSASKEGDVWEVYISVKLSSATNDNIGDYIDLGYSIVGTDATTDDWRILYVEGDTVYAILADYLPNNTGYAANAGLDMSNTYSVYSNTDRDTLMNGLTTTTYWNGLANGISGATVTGAPTAELLMKSYNTKNGTDENYMFEPELEESDLYMPHTSEIDNCYGYWLGTFADEADMGDDNYKLWKVEYDGYVSGIKHSSVHIAVRPVVSLPSSTTATKSGKIWTITEHGGTSGFINWDLGLVTNNNIGNYIDLGNNIVGTSATTDDWRILYADENYVYAILADYLPNSTKYAANAGLDTYNTYGVCSDKDRDTLLNGLTTSTYWNGLANGISGATVTGAPTAELLMKSYNTKNGTSLDYTTGPKLDAETADFYLYVPHPDDAIGNCYGYWMGSPEEDATDSVYDVGYDNWINTCGYDDSGMGVRPIVALPSNTGVTKEGIYWIVTE